VPYFRIAHLPVGQAYSFAAGNQFGIGVLVVQRFYERNIGMGYGVSGRNPAMAPAIHNNENSFLRHACKFTSKKSHFSAKFLCIREYLLFGDSQR
jgi:hypothetical protein